MGYAKAGRTPDTRDVAAARLLCLLKMIFASAFVNLNARAAATNVRFVSLVVALIVGGLVSSLTQQSLGSQLGSAHLYSAAIPVPQFLRAPASARDLLCTQPTLATSPLASLSQA